MPIRGPSIRTILLSVTLLAAAIAFLAPDSAAARAIDDIRMSRSGDLATAELSFGCSMRYLDHTPQIGGTELRIRLALARECNAALSGVLNELHRPESRHMADMDELEFDMTTPEQGTIILRFEHPVGFKVSQGANPHSLQIEIDPDALSRLAKQDTPPLPPTTETPALPEAPPLLRAPVTTDVPAPIDVDQTKSESIDRRPLRLVPRREPAIQDMFAISLASYSTQETIDPASLYRFRSYVVHTTDVAINGQKWKELRIGFFATEDHAQAELLRISDEFPGAWISVASPEERTLAQENRLELAAAPRPEPAPDDVVDQAEITDEVDTVMAMSGDRIAELMTEARSALLVQDYGRSIRVYTRLLEEPEGAHRREAREFLGVAREKNGQLAHATAEYQAYLVEFPEGADATRVQQRLAALADDADNPQDGLRSARDRQTTGWEWFGSASQFYRRGVNLGQDDEADVVSQSALISQGDVLVSRRGKRFDLLGRINLTYLYDFEDLGRGDQALVSFAYLDIADQDLNLSARVGRQTRYTGGVLGRFDGAHFSYNGWRPDLTINLTAGYPVDSIFFEPNSDRSFVGMSVDLANVADVWDVSVFTNLGEVDGISDREAVGAEVQYHNGRWDLVGLVDYDTSYSALNTALLVGNWRFNDRITLNARISGGASPFLTTSNALIGQPVTSIRSLLQTFTEPQVRRLARNRTAVETLNTSFGVSMPLTQRFHLNGDIGVYDSNGTVASGGVVGIPAMGPSYFASANFVGSSLFKDRDTVIFGIRHNSSDTYTMNTLLFDMRYPFGSGFRFNPRLAVSLRENDLDGSEVVIASPLLRFLYRWRKRFRIELEVGGQWFSQELPPSMISPLTIGDTIETAVYYVNVGYWMDF